MAEVAKALLDPQLAFFRYALLMGLLAAIPFGIIGTFVVVRRISYLAGALSHSVLAGIGGGLYVQRVVGITWFTPIHGALVAALLAAVLLTLVGRYSHQREDSTIGAIWAGGMAIGLLFIARTPGYFDPMSYLFGNILMVSRSDLLFVLLLDLLVVIVVALFYHKLLALCFDEEFAWLRGLATPWLSLFLLCLTAVTIVLLVRLVGIVLVIALLTLPPALAGNFAHNIKQMMLGSIVCCALFIVSGLAISFQLDLPSGPIIIVIGATVYLLVVGGLRLARIAGR